jgi:hypothetical protein
MNRKKLIAVVVLCAASASVIYFASARWYGSRGDSRESLLRSLPPDATAAVYVDVAELRQGAILKNLAGLGANAAVDQDYKQFVNETGFDYERDLDRVGVVIQTAGPTNHYFALADGRFDRKKIEVYLRKNGVSQTKDGREIFLTSLPNSNPYVSTVEHPVFISFLSEYRIALTDAPDLNVEIESGKRDAGHAEWTDRFARLAGSPFFALIRQDAAIGAILNAQAPGGFRSPQLVQLLNQLLWISIAGKPEGTGVRVVAEGECPNEMTMRQLADFLNGITLMAQGGLNDPKLRQQMDPAERDAYMQLVNSVEVMRLDRGSSKSVRMAMLITPEAWDKMAKAPPFAPPQENPSSTKTEPTKKKAESKPEPAKR